MFLSVPGGCLAPLGGVVLPIRLTTTSHLINGRPRQVAMMWQNMRCSILFRLLVPGGKRHTWTGKFNLAVPA